MKSITKIAIRMMALYYIVHGISNIPSFLYYMGAIRDKQTFFAPIEFIGTLLPIGISLITGTILWIVADNITKSMLNKEDEITTFPLPMIQTLQVALIIIGVIMIINAIPLLFSNIFLQGKLEGFQTLFSVKSEIIKQGLKIVIGILVVIFAPFITKNIFKVVQVEKTNEK